MYILRLLAVGLLFLALIFFGYDQSNRFGSSPGITSLRLSELWSLVHRTSRDGVEAFIREQASFLFINEMFQTLLSMQAWLAAGSIGLLLYIASYRPRPAVYAPGAQALSTLPSSDGLRGSELNAALARCRTAFVGVGVFSGIGNILMLTGSFYMLEIYDRVLPSRSVPTLIALSILVAILFIFQGLIDLIRGRLLVRIAGSVDEALSRRVYDCVVLLPLKTASQPDGLQPLRDLDSVRSFLSGLGPTALFDMPWMPLYLCVIFAFHPVLGFAALAGAISLVALTALAEVLTRGPTKAATAHGMSRNALAGTSRRNAEVLAAMGMAGFVGDRWSQANRSYMRYQMGASDVATGLGAISKYMRMLLQSGMLGLGAYLVINHEATGGIIIASSILTFRALAPVDLAIGHWRGFISARQSWQRLTKLLALLPQQRQQMMLPAPKNSLSVEQASVTPPGTARMVVNDVSLTLKSGQGLGVIGPSASGKSSLARMLVGVWQPVRGKIRIDGAALDQWTPEARGRHIGYLPQDVELFAGTVAENICRFDPNPDFEAILAAAQASGVHDLIVNLPNGYETEIGEQGTALSAGQQQRVALARAVYRDPFLVVLDEPNSNLDAEGESSLTQAILGIRARGGVVVVIAHRSSAIAGVDMLLVMAQGRVQAFGPKDDVLAKMLRPAPAPIPFKIIPEASR